MIHRAVGHVDDALVCTVEGSVDPHPLGTVRVLPQFDLDSPSRNLHPVTVVAAGILSQEVLCALNGDEDQFDLREAQQVAALGLHLVPVAGEGREKQHQARVTVSRIPERDPEAELSASGIRTVQVDAPLLRKKLPTVIDWVADAGEQRADVWEGLGSGRRGGDGDGHSIDLVWFGLRSELLPTAPTANAEGAGREELNLAEFEKLHWTGPEVQGPAEAGRFVVRHWAGDGDCVLPLRDGEGIDDVEERCGHLVGLVEVSESPA